MDSLRLLQNLKQRKMKVKAIKTFTTGRARRVTPETIFEVSKKDGDSLIKNGLVVLVKEEKAVRKTKEQK